MRASRAWRLVALIGMTLTGHAAAQPSTGNLQPVGRTLHVELAAGFESSAWSLMTAPDASPGARAVVGGVRLEPTSWGALRGLGWLVRRNTEDAGGSSHDALNAITMAGDLELRVGGGVTLAASAGAGAASVHATDTWTESSGGGPRTEYRSGSGRVITFGAAIRWAHLTAEWHMLALLNAQDVIQNHREYFPLTLGIRW